MKHWVAQALSLLMALCLFLPCFAAAEEAAQTAVTIDFEDGNAASVHPEPGSNSLIKCLFQVQNQHTS